MKKKDVQEEVRKLIDQGVPRSDVYARLAGNGVKDSLIAYMVAAQPYPDVVKKHEGKVKVLIGLMLAQALIGAIAGFSLGAQIGPNAKWIFGAFLAGIGLLFAWGFHKNKVGFYNAYLLLSFVQLPKQFHGFSESPVETSVVVGAGIAILAFVMYVRFSLFPDFIAFSPKKIKGSYQFTS